MQVEPLTDQDRQLLEISQDSNRIILLNKVDLPEKIEIDQLPEDHIKISVLKNQNIDQIEDRINALFFENAGLVEQDATYLSNARHISLIEKAVESLQAVNEGLALGMPVDLLQVDLTRTWEILGEITGMLLQMSSSPNSSVSSVLVNNKKWAYVSSTYAVRQLFHFTLKWGRKQ